VKKEDLWRQAAELYDTHGSFKAAEAVSGISRSTLHTRRTKWIEHTTGSPPTDKRKQLRSPNKDEIEKICVDFYTEKKRRPTYTELLTRGVNKDLIRKRYGNISALIETVETKFTDEIANVIATGRVLFSRDRFEHISEVVGNQKKFFITTAVAGKEIHTGFLDAIRSYCVKNKAVPLILPTADPDKGGMTDEHLLSYDPKLSYENVIPHPVALNNSISISGIKIRAKQIQPLTGMARLGQRNNSTIIASPKQQLIYTATSNAHRMPHAGICTGALTVADYSNVRFAGARTAALATNDHVIGGIIVEIVNEKYYHFRQVQADEDGSFIDLSKKYSPDGSVTSVRATLVPGDWHAGATDPFVKQSIGEMLKSLNVETLVLHDFFDGYSINHHDHGSLLKRSMKYERGLSSLENEFQIGTKDLEWLMEKFDGQIIVVKSNHCEFVDKYIHTGNYTKDPQNARVAHDIWVKMSEGEDPISYGYKKYGGLNSDRVIFLRRDESFKIANVELAAHGDLGANGSKSSPNSIENAYGNCIVGHAHTAMIHRGVYRVGTSTKLDLDYNKGPSSWTHTCCLLYNNGSRQLINFLSGDPDFRGAWVL
jgi:hypothetical protein